MPSRIQRVEVIALLILSATLTSGCDYLAGLERTLKPPTGDAALPPTGDVSPPPIGDVSPPSNGGLAPPATRDDDPDATFDPGDPYGPAEATYRTGRATLTIGNDVITLDRLAGPGTYFAEFGADVIWTSKSGWYVQLGGAKANIGPLEIPAYIALDRVKDGQHWVSWDPDGCRVSIKQADRGAVRGTASCTNMRWVDAIAGGLAEEPTPIRGQPPFSATITFFAGS
jgi:hypothetical protein